MGRGWWREERGGIAPQAPQDDSRLLYLVTMERTCRLPGEHGQGVWVMHFCFKKNYGYCLKVK